MKQNFSVILQESISAGVKALQQGEIISYPTEAVYGLGVDPFNDNAIADLLRLKHRPLSKGFILIASTWRQIEHLVKPLSPQILTQIHATWPGPNTWLFPASSEVPQWLTGGHDTIALRVTAHPVAHALCEQFGGPIVSTSANLQGQPPARNLQTLYAYFQHDVAVHVDGECGTQHNPSRICDAITGQVVREG